VPGTKVLTYGLGIKEKNVGYYRDWLSESGLAAGFLTVQLLPGKAVPEAVELGMRFMRAKLTAPPI